MKVNMTPNPLDVVTIHASQGDTEARQWEFELHNNGELIDTSGVTDQMVFKAYKGGTEQILPENTSVPTTSPIIADIQYKDALRSEQEFLYRESPTTVDGKAKITKIKGNTLVWNQLVENGNFADTSFWTTCAYRFTFSVASNKGTFTASGNDPQIRFPADIKSGHKYLFMAKMENGANVVSTYIRAFQNFITSQVIVPIGTALGQFKYVFTASDNFNIIDIRGYRTGNQTLQTDDYFNLSNVMLIDLTKMFGSGNEPATVDEFTSLFPFTYYAYDTGSMLSFNGTGLKTIGFNQWDEEWELGSIDANGENTPSTVEIRSKNYIPVILGESYYIKQTGVQVFHFYDGNLKYLGNQYIGEPRLLNIPSGTEYIRFRCANTYGTFYKNDICLNISDPSRNGEYEPYTESTLSLPISTYFPNGMKSAGSVYDEWTPNKATPRVGEVTFDGTQTVAGSNFSSTQCRMFIEVPNVKPFNPSTNGDVDNGIISSYLQSTSNDATFSGAKGIHRRINGSSQICVSLGADGYASGITTETLFNQYLASHPLTVYYELATESETTFTTASLVTENGEIPLSNEDGVLIGKCTEQLSADAGFIEGKIKLSDEDGDVYSNKIQIHVERSPQ